MSKKELRSSEKAAKLRFCECYGAGGSHKQISCLHEKMLVEIYEGSAIS